MPIDLATDHNCIFRTKGNYTVGPFVRTDDGYTTAFFPELIWGRYGMLISKSSPTKNPDNFTLTHILKRFPSEGETKMTMFNELVTANKEAATGALKARAVRDAMNLVMKTVNGLSLPPSVQAVLQGPFGPLIVMNVVVAFAESTGNEQAERLARLALSGAYQDVLSAFLPDLSELMAGLAKINLPST